MKAAGDDDKKLPKSRPLLVRHLLGNRLLASDSMISYRYTMRFIGYDSIETSLVISHGFEDHIMTLREYKRIGPTNRIVKP